VFGDRLGHKLADRCLAVLLDAGPPGLTRGQLREHLGNRLAADGISRALQLLRRAGRAEVTSLPTSGRAAELWTAVEVTACPGRQRCGEV
jgi:hypothetical protein